MSDADRDTVDYDAATHLDNDDEFAGELPPRPRQRLLTVWSALLFAVLLGGVGFYVGIRVEKSHGSSSTSAFASRAAAFTGGAGARGAPGAATGKTKAGGASGAPAGFTRGAGGFAAGGFGNATTGTVASIDGDTLYVTETGGNTVKVKLSDATTITKSSTVSKKKVYPGDSVTIEGKTSGGKIAATSVTDAGTGSSPSSSAPSSSSGSSSSSSASSAVSSLFGR